MKLEYRYGLHWPVRENRKMNEPKFKVGDKVRAFGVDGVVDAIHPESNYPVCVKYSHPDCLDYGGDFTMDGRYARWHKEPSLVLIERPKRKVKRSKILWFNIYPYGPTGFGHVLKEWADELAGKDRIACVKVPIEWEEEVEGAE